RRGITQIIEIGSVQRGEHLSAELQIESFSQLETFTDSQIEIPVPRSFEDVAPSAVRSRRRDGKRAGILENDRTDQTRHFLQANLRLSAHYIRPRLMREVGRADAAANAERFSGHERVNSVEPPAADEMVQRRVNRRSESLLSPNREFPE